MNHSSQLRTYAPTESVVFLKTNERFGGLSNMAGGFPLRVNGVRIRTSEALYQACRFPHMPGLQRDIIAEASPMTAKMRGKPYRNQSRPDWDAVRVKIMRWCLRVKLAQNWQEFGRLLLATADRPIVEQSRKDDFWGAKVADDGMLVGINVLGRLLMELREQLKGSEADSLRLIEPLPIPEFLLYGQPIERVEAPTDARIPGFSVPPPARPATPPEKPAVPQPSLFDAPTTVEARTASVAARPHGDQDRQRPKLYPRDQATRHEWLGDIPGHWGVIRGKYLFREIDDRTDTGTETLLSMRQAHGLIPHRKVSTKPVTPEELKGYKRVRTGQVVLNRMQASNGMFAVAYEGGLVSPDYAVFQPLRPMEPDYFVTLFKTTAYRAKFRQESKGLGTGTSGFLRLYSDRFGAIHVPQPPEDEQRKIVQFIRSYDHRVRRLIRSKRRLIELLNEQKQAIINQAVTRGLNPDVPMKATGIDWIPKIPAHWEIRKVKQVASFNPSRTESSSDFNEDSEVVFLPMENVSTSGEIDCNARGKISDLRSGYTYFKRHDVVVAKITPCFENGKGAYLGLLETEIGFGTTEFVVLRANPEIDPRFLYQVTMLHAFRRDGEMAMTGAAGQQRVPLSFMREFMFGLPDLPEQETILSFVGRETQKIDQTIEKAKSEISLVMEYRDRLIADVVTGKLDVRHVEIAASSDEPVADEGDALEKELETDDASRMEEADADE